MKKIYLESHNKKKHEKNYFNSHQEKHRSNFSYWTISLIVGTYNINL